MGFVKLSSDLERWAWINDPKTVYIYVRLLLGAAWQEKDIGNVHLRRGEIAISQRKFAAQCSVTHKELRTALDRLIATQKVAQRIERKVSIITLCEYDCDMLPTAQSAAQKRHNEGTITAQSGHNEGTPTLLNTKEQNIKNPEIHAPAREKPAEKPRTVEQAKPEKREFAEFVSMTNDEYSSLVTKLGEQGAKRCIEILDNYKGANGKKYASDYRAILNWVVSRYNEENAKCNSPSAQSGQSNAQNSPNRSFADMLKNLGGGGEIDV